MKKNLSTKQVNKPVNNRRASCQTSIKKPLHGALANQRTGSLQIGHRAQITLLIALGCFAGALVLEILKAGGSI